MADYSSFAKKQLNFKILSHCWLELKPIYIQFLANFHKSNLLLWSVIIFRNLWPLMFKNPSWSYFTFTIAVYWKYVVVDSWWNIASLKSKCKIADEMLRRKFDNDPSTIFIFKDNELWLNNWLVINFFGLYLIFWLQKSKVITTIEISLE